MIVLEPPIQYLIATPVPSLQGDTIADLVNGWQLSIVSLRQCNADKAAVMDWADEDAGQ